jgi:14-3-3 protein epsilon
MKNIDDVSHLAKEELIYLARLSEQTKRYQEMPKYIKAFLSHTSQDLTIEERYILSIAYKNIIGARRNSWRVLNSIEQKEERRSNPVNKSSALKYKKEVENELASYCNEILEIIDRDLMPRAASSESRVFYHKMKGDYYRYLSEIADGNEKNAGSERAEMSYQAAYSLALRDLLATHPTRLGLALNFSVFYFEIKRDKERACEIAKNAFDEAIPGLENVTEDNYKDATIILHLIKDNLEMWENEANKRD